MQDQNTADLAALAGRADRYHGHIYVIEFSNSTIKVGQTLNPRSRLRAHRQEASKFNVGITNLWVSDPHLEYVDNERDLIKYAASIGNTASGVEYFDGCDFSSVSAFAQALPSSRLTEEELADWKKRADEASDEFFARLTGRNADLSVVHPLVAAIFKNPEDLFRMQISLGESETCDELMSQVVRMAEVTDESVDDLLDSNYIDMMERVAIAFVKVQARSLTIWALESRRTDILATYRDVIGGAA